MELVAPGGDRPGSVEAPQMATMGLVVSASRLSSPNEDGVQWLA